jgi:PilZ domain
MSVTRVRVIQSGVKSAPPAAVRADEKRRSTRRGGRSPGLIYPGGMAASIPCTIADQSVTGARLVMQDGWVNPFLGSSSLGQSFTLVMRLDKMEVGCEIVRLDQTELGVRFTSVPRPVQRKI